MPPPSPYIVNVVANDGYASLERTLVRVQASLAGSYSKAIDVLKVRMTIPTAPALRRILGLGFGLSMVFGGTVGVGILRLPSSVAAALGDSRLVVLFWVLGGLYALLGAVAVAELAALMPVAVGFRVYAARAFGDGPGFVIGWTDWLCTLAALAYGSIAAATFLGALWPAALLYPRTFSVAILGTLTGLHWFGVKIGSRLTSGISLAVGSMLMILVGGCFFTEPVSVGAAAPLTKTVASLPWRPR